MANTWVLIANAQQARCFARHAIKHTLSELACFVHAHERLSDVPSKADLTGAAGKGHGRTGHAGTQFEPHTSVQGKERSDFALQLAKYLNEGVAARRCDALMLITTSPILGELRLHLSDAAQKALRNCVASDFTRYEGVDLEARVNQALQLPD
ncbi:MAG: host attachment protein [Burkholderiaceae bacterium]